MSIDPANERKEAAMAAPDTSMRTAPADSSAAETALHLLMHPASAGNPHQQPRP